MAEKDKKPSNGSTKSGVKKGYTAPPPPKKPSGGDGGKGKSK